MVSHAHLHHEITGQLLEPCVGRIVDLQINPDAPKKVASKKGERVTIRPLHHCHLLNKPAISSL